MWKVLGTAWLGLERVGMCLALVWDVCGTRLHGFGAFLDVVGLCL